MSLRGALALVLIGLFWGCTTSQPTLQAGPASRAFFSSTPEERETLHGLAKKLDPFFQSCKQHNSCDEVHFTRGLLALFDDREVAAASFREASKSAVAGPFALPSARWLQLLSEDFPAVTENMALAEHAKSMAQLWVNRMTTPPAGTCDIAAEPPQKRDPVLQGLQRRVQARDRRIAELTDQLKALKQIDMDGTVHRKLGTSGKVQTEK